MENEDLIVDGKRINGRAFDQIRDAKIVAGVLGRADGSAYVELGNNKIYAAVYGPRQVFPKYMQNPDRAIIRCRYNMAPFSVEDRKRPGPDRRSVEISKVTRECLEPSVFLERFPNSMIDVFIEVMQADAGTRCTGITAAAVALASSVFPVPGGPCNKIPLGGSIPNLSKSSGCFRGSSIISLTFCISSCKPPRSS